MGGAVSSGWAGCGTRILRSPGIRGSGGPACESGFDTSAKCAIGPGPGAGGLLVGWARCLGMRRFTLGTTQKINMLCWV